jgi:hypothetical protein
LQVVRKNLAATVEDMDEDEAEKERMEREGVS